MASLAVIAICLHSQTKMNFNSIRPKKVELECRLAMVAPTLLMKSFNILFLELCSGHEWIDNINSHDGLDEDDNSGNGRWIKTARRSLMTTLSKSSIQCSHRETPVRRPLPMNKFYFVFNFILFLFSSAILNVIIRSMKHWNGERKKWKRIHSLISILRKKIQK